MTDYFEKGNLKLHRMDCMELMKSKYDNYYDLAIVDPPYAWNKKGNNIDMRRTYHKKQWNENGPTKEYFNELFRISKNTIIWGGNYFNLPPTRCFIFWDKVMTVKNYADGEYAWTSFDSNAKMFRYSWNGFLQADMKNKEIRIHVTQKPIALYRWLLKNFAKPGDKIIDTHGGSFSSAIAAYYFDCEFEGCELDQDYFNDAIKRVDEQTNQLKLL